MSDITVISLTIPCGWHGFWLCPAEDLVPHTHRFDGDDESIVVRVDWKSVYRSTAVAT